MPFPLKITIRDIENLQIRLLLRRKVKYFLIYCPNDDSLKLIKAYSKLLMILKWHFSLWRMTDAMKEDGKFMKSKTYLSGILL